jgi:small subunit ribosomal protein S13
MINMAQQNQDSGRSTGRPQMPKPQEPIINADGKQLRNVVNMISTDIPGNKKLIVGLRMIKGVSFMLANAIMTVSGFDRNEPIGYLSKEDILKIEDVIKHPRKYNIPVWMINRRKDYDTGEDLHVSGANMNYVTENDIKRMKKIRSYKGIRHAAGLPVRGQRTKSKFRKTKSANSKRKKK